MDVPPVSLIELAGMTAVQALPTINPASTAHHSIADV
jgi:hypothetical protein